MVKVKLIIDRLDDLKENVKRKKGDIFEVTEERAEYLAGNNPKQLKAVEIIENKTKKTTVENVDNFVDNSNVSQRTPRKKRTKKTIENEK